VQRVVIELLLGVARKAVGDHALVLGVSEFDDYFAKDRRAAKGGRFAGIDKLVEQHVKESGDLAGIFEFGLNDARSVAAYHFTVRDEVFVDDVTATTKKKWTESVGSLRIATSGCKSTSALDTAVERLAASLDGMVPCSVRIEYVAVPRESPTARKSGLEAINNLLWLCTKTRGKLHVGTFAGFTRMPLSDQNTLYPALFDPVFGKAPEGQRRGREDDDAPAVQTGGPAVPPTNAARKAPPAAPAASKKAAPAASTTAAPAASKTAAPAASTTAAPAANKKAAPKGSQALTAAAIRAVAIRDVPPPSQQQEQQQQKQQPKQQGKQQQPQPQAQLMRHFGKQQQHAKADAIPTTHNVGHLHQPEDRVSKNWDQDFGIRGIANSSHACYSIVSLHLVLHTPQIKKLFSDMDPRRVLNPVDAALKRLCGLVNASTPCVAKKQPYVDMMEEMTFRSTLRFKFDETEQYDLTEGLDAVLDGDAARVVLDGDAAPTVTAAPAAAAAAAAAAAPAVTAARVVLDGDAAPAKTAAPAAPAAAAPVDDAAPHPAVVAAATAAAAAEAASSFPGRLPELADVFGITTEEASELECGHGRAQRMPLWMLKVSIKNLAALHAASTRTRSMAELTLQTLVDHEWGAVPVESVQECAECTKLAEKTVKVKATMTTRIVKLPPQLFVYVDRALYHAGLKQSIGVDASRMVCPPALTVGGEVFDLRAFGCYEGIVPQSAAAVLSDSIYASMIAAGHTDAVATAAAVAGAAAAPEEPAPLVYDGHYIYYERVREEGELRWWVANDGLVYRSTTKAQKVQDDLMSMAVVLRYEKR
jgi:hypothetical protein